MQLRMLATSLIMLAGAFFASLPASAADPENTLVLTLKGGDVTIVLRPDLAPKHFAQIKALVREGA